MEWSERWRSSKVKTGNPIGFDNMRSWMTLIDRSNF